MSEVQVSDAPRAKRPYNRRVPREAAPQAAAASQAEAPEAAPITRAQPRGSEFLDENGEVLTRRSRKDGGTADFDVPVQYKKPGWDYQWWTSRVMGQDVDAADTADIYEGGWRPVKSKDMPKMCPPGWAREHVERRGQTLYMRPMKLTREARDEDLDRAERQKVEKLQAALAGPSDMTRHTKRAIDTIEISGHVGTARESE